MDRRSKLIEILSRVAQKDVNPADDESLFDSGTLDSFALPDLNPRKFETVARIGEYLDARQ